MLAKNIIYVKKLVNLKQASIKYIEYIVSKNFKSQRAAVTFIYSIYLGSNIEEAF